MRKYLVFVVVSLLLVAFSMNADRRRPARPWVEPTINSVEAIMAVIYLDKDGLLVQEGDPWHYCWVSMQSMRPLTAGTTFTYSVQKPGAGEGDFTFIRSRTVEPHQAGFYTSSNIYLLDGFYDMVNGVKQDWLPGIAVFKTNIETTKGEKTSIIHKVPVRLDELRVPLGPLQQAVVSVDGKSIMLLGVFSTPPSAMLFHFYPDGTWNRRPVGVSQNQFTVPDGMYGLGSPLTVMSGYPGAECSTVQVDIPVPEQNKSLFSEK